MDQVIKSVILKDFHNENYEIVKKLYKGNRYTGFTFLPLFVIYDSPKDFVKRYVIRIWLVNRNLGITVPTQYCVVKSTLEGCRQALPPKLTRIERDFSDDPVIIETWC